MPVAASILMSLAVVYGFVSAAAVNKQGPCTPLWLRWPVGCWESIKRPINRAVYGPQPTPKADPLKIAVLEYELFGIEPKPGTAAEAVIRLRRINGI